MKNLDIDLVDHHEASVESSGDGYVYVTVDAEFGLIPDSPIYLEYQLLCLKDDVVVSSSDPSSAELTFENPRVYITDSFHAGEDQIPDSYKINFRVFVPDEPVVIDTPIPPEIARQSGAFLIHSPKKGLLSREKWASGGVTAESVVVKNVAGEDDELFVNLAAKNHTQSGFVLTCESADNSDYTIFKIIDKPQVTSDHLRLHLKKDLKVTLVGYLAGDWKSTEKTAITEIKQNFQGSSDSSHTLDELAAEGIRITTDEIMRWRGDLNFGMELNPSLAAELVDFDDPEEFVQTIRYLAGYAIDKYRFAHEDHERDWAGNILLLDAFKAYRARAVSEWDGIENPSEEEADEYISVEALVNCSGFSKKDTTLLAYNYLLSMRGAALYDEPNDPQLTNDDWRRELAATLEFLTSAQSGQITVHCGDPEWSEYHDSNEDFFAEDNLGQQIYIFCVDPWGLDDFDESQADTAIEMIIDAIASLADRVKMHLDNSAQFFVMSGGTQREISTASDIRDSWKLNDKKSLENLIAQEGNYLRLIVLAKGGNYWNKEFLKMSSDKSVPHFNVWGYYPPLEQIAVQGYAFGDFDTGIAHYPDDESYYTGQERMDYYGIIPSMFEVKTYA